MTSDSWLHMADDEAQQQTVTGGKEKEKSGADGGGDAGGAGGLDHIGQLVQDTVLAALPDIVLGLQRSITSSLAATATAPGGGGAAGGVLGGAPVGARTPPPGGGGEAGYGGTYAPFAGTAPAAGSAGLGAVPAPATYGNRAAYGVQNHLTPGYVIPPDPEPGCTLPAADLLYKRLKYRPLSVPELEYCVPGYGKLKPEEKHELQKTYYSVTRIGAILKANGQYYVLPPAVTRELTDSYQHLQERVAYLQQIALSDAGYRSLSRQYFQATAKSLLEEDTATTIPGRFGQVHKLQSAELRKQTAKQIAITEAARQKLKDSKPRR